MKKTSRPTSASRKRSGARRRPSSSPGRTGRSPAERLLADLARVAAESRLRWYLFGAQAAILYGSPRTTADVDATFELPPGRTTAFVRAMQKAGFALRVPANRDFVAATRVLPFEHRDSGWPLDVVLAGPGLEETFLASAQELDVGGTSVPVIAPEHLIALKVLAGRPKDLEDVRSLLRSGAARWDLEEVRGVLRALERALAQDDLLPSFEQLLREASRGGSKP